ncbi:aminotransferase class V-fold PLP-dependent enzyme [Cellulophaga omnivescoria]|uniref:aminotransferase class V-fold PLP-dependent enzyme n=1 Tax=Cellulophaga omnivescoria TaxID=1888890 RepID=UPI000985B732|nr:aminotransferase class V-fold PLP-dependent enzyme [Cellulophaga omnivescoria]WBU88635.1 aminotransferase class V-fold PLP-dependent enzyme [Cellulophaga omnivescoria]
MSVKEQVLVDKSLENYFQQFSKGVVGNKHYFKTLYGQQKLVYADWIASGRLYAPIEEKMQYNIGPMVANTHSFSSETGKASTYAYKLARKIIKEHVNANEDDILVTTGTGMTGAIVKLQRIIGLRKSFKHKPNKQDRPVVFITHMEHHSNHVSWMETLADVVILDCDENKLVDVNSLEQKLLEYADRPIKIGAFTACSNVTGIITPYQELAKIMHKHNGYCVVDFAASAPYVKMDMHPADPEAYLDAIAFSPHKFLGGPGSCGVLVFNKKLYNAKCPDTPGGGNVKWTNPWGSYSYFDDIEVKEDGGTPGFLQTIRAALAIRLKDQMEVTKIHKREEELLQLSYQKLSEINGLEILGSTDVPRIGCISFTIKNIHYNLIVRLLNDRFGIQVRGGWSCASTYGHYLFDIDKKESKKITRNIIQKDLTNKPGWVRLSLHPLMTNEDIIFISDALKEIQKKIALWKCDYQYNSNTNEWDCLQRGDQEIKQEVCKWFSL